MQNNEYFSQLLYLLVYSSALICVAAVVVFRTRLKTEPGVHLNRFILSLAFTGSLVSIQVFLNAVGILDRLNESSTSRLIIIMNMLIIAAISLIVHSAVSISLLTRPSGFNRRIIFTVSVVITAMLINTAALQILTLVSHSTAASALLEIVMSAGIILYAAGITFSAIRLFIPLRMKDDPVILPAIRLNLLFILILPAFYIISDSLIGALLAPAGFIAINILSLRILYLRLNTHPKDHAKKDEPETAATCRELGLSGRETDVALLLAEGRSYKEIAADLCISMSTTQTHVGRIYTKLGINSKTELANLLFYKKT